VDTQKSALAGLRSSRGTGDEKVRPGTAGIDRQSFSEYESVFEGEPNENVAATPAPADDTFKVLTAEEEELYA
jgi:hypothetical protein